MGLTNGIMVMKISQTVENLVYLFLLEYPEVDAETMHKIWERNVILKEYKRPSLGHLKLLILMIRDELEDKGVKFN